MIDYMTGSKLAVNVLDTNAHLHHKHHCVISKVGKFVNRFGLIVCLARDYNLGAFLADF